MITKSDCDQIGLNPAHKPLIQSSLNSIIHPKRNGNSIKSPTSRCHFSWNHQNHLSLSLLAPSSAYASVLRVGGHNPRWHSPRGPQHACGLSRHSTRWGNLICFPVSHVYFIVGGGQSL